MSDPWKTCGCCGRTWWSDDHWRSDTKFVGHQEVEEGEPWPMELRLCPACHTSTTGDMEKVLHEAIVNRAADQLLDDSGLNGMVAAEIKARVDAVFKGLTQSAVDDAIRHGFGQAVGGSYLKLKDGLRVQIQTRVWTDKQGEKRYTTEINAREPEDVPV